MSKQILFHEIESLMTHSFNQEPTAKWSWSTECLTERQCNPLIVNEILVWAQSYAYRYNRDFTSNHIHFNDDEIIKYIGAVWYMLQLKKDLTI